MKYDILKHPNVKYTSDGKGKPYIHSNIDKDIATIIFDDDISKYEFTDIKDISDDYIIITSEELEEYFSERE